MSVARMHEHGVMEGRGAYNRHATVQAAGGASALPLLEKAAQEIAIDAADQPLVIADYGCSQGKNSLAPMRAAIAALRRRIGSRRPIMVFHTDQPANDFGTLFDVLETDPDRYVRDEQHVFPCAIGGSFYGHVLPPDHVHLGWSAYAAHWLSRIPALIPGHFFPPRSTGAVRALFQHQAAQDWEAFLALRAMELRPGGRLVVVLPAFNEGGVSGAEQLADRANAVLGEMVDEAEITADERAQMVLASFPRGKRDLLAPFLQEGQFHGLAVAHCDVSAIPDAAWADYQEDGCKEVLAAKHALFFRSTFIPTLATALGRDRGVEERRVFGDRLGDRLKRRLENHPAPLDLFVGTIVLTKRGGT